MSDRYFLTAAQVADVLNISEPSVLQKAKAGKLPFPREKFGRSVRFRRKLVEDYIGGPLEPEVANA